MSTKAIQGSEEIIADMTKEAQGTTKFLSKLHREDKELKKQWKEERLAKNIIHPAPPLKQIVSMLTKMLINFVSSRNNDLGCCE